MSLPDYYSQNNNHDLEEEDEAPISANSPVKVSNRFNPKISKAKSCVSDNKVELNEKHGHYEVTDEQSKCWIVKQFPKPFCSCNEQHNCIHVYAVQALNNIYAN